jgi:hypothetical protein
VQLFSNSCIYIYEPVISACSRLPALSTRSVGMRASHASRASVPVAAVPVRLLKAFPCRSTWTNRAQRQHAKKDTQSAHEMESAARQSTEGLLFCSRKFLDVGNASLLKSRFY